MFSDFFSGAFFMGSDPTVCGVVCGNRPLRGTHPIVLFDWQPSRHSDHPREFLKTFSGTVITDGYQVYHKLAKERRDLKVAGCWIHATQEYSVNSLLFFQNIYSIHLLIFVYPFIFLFCIF